MTENRIKNKVEQKTGTKQEAENKNKKILTAKELKAGKLKEV